MDETGVRFSHPAPNEQDRYYFLTDDKIIQRVTFNMWFVFKKVMLITVTVFVVVILFLQLIDTLAGPATPTFHDAPQVFCEKTRFIGIALPPFGIYLCPEAKDSESTWAHELVHWDQYKSKGFVMFYVSYGLGYLESDFVYMDHPMEIEARQREAEFMRTDATSSTQ